MEDGSTWELWERDGVLTLQLDGMPCANSFTYGSEEAMAELATSPITRAGQPCIMIAGLGLGYGLAKAMECLPKEKARFIVAEPVPEIVKWNREFGEPCGKTNAYLPNPPAQPIYAASAPVPCMLSCCAMPTHAAR